MSVPPKTDQDVPPPHRRTLPHVPVNEQGIRELEIWLEERLGDGKGLQYHRGTYGPHNRGDWLDVLARKENPRVASGSGSGMKFISLLGDILIQTGSGSGLSHWLTLVHGTEDLIQLAEDSVFLQSVSIANRIKAGGAFTVSRPTTITHTVATILNIASDTGDVTFRFVDAAGVFVVEDHTGTLHGVELFKITDAGVLTFNGLSVNMQTSGGTINIESTGSVGLTSSASSARVDGSTGVTLVSANGDIQANVGSGATFRVNDSSFDPLTEIEDDGSFVHNIVTAGETFVINDSNGNPMVTYTG